MKVIQLNSSDINGGAARAAYRIHHALRDAGIESKMLVNSKLSGDWTVEGPSSKLKEGILKVRSNISRKLVNSLFKTSNSTVHSASILPSGRVRTLNQSDADVLNLHWVQGEMLSIAEIGQISKPFVFTLHDMWAFCGAEHYTEDCRWINGYYSNNRPTDEAGFDLNRWTWERKRKHWKRPFFIVTPSQWLADCVHQSELMKGWPLRVIPNPIDTQVWKPLDKDLARELLGLPKKVPMVLFGAIGGSQDQRKGFDLLKVALQYLKGSVTDLQLIIFGEMPPKDLPDLGFPVHYLGHLHDDLCLRAMYCAADLFVLPSRLDNLPNTGVESLACGTPIVAFNTGGLSDIVEHGITGYLAKAFDSEDLAFCIRSIIIDDNLRYNMSLNARTVATIKYDYAEIAKQYRNVYEQVLSG